MVEPNSDNELDKWLLAKLYDTYNKINNCMKIYHIDEYVEPLVDLINGFSTWYLRRSRRRFWESEKSKDKQNAYETTYYVLINLLKLMAPITPILSDYLYRKLTGEESIHLALFDDIPTKYKNEEILKETNVVQRIISLTRNLREKVNIKIRQPLSRLDVAFNNNNLNYIVNKFNDIISEEINVKQVNLVNDTSNIANIEYIPNFKTLGPKFGNKMKVLSDLIKKGEFKKDDNNYILELDNQKYRLDLDDINIRYNSKNAELVINDEDILVHLDTNLTDELKQEGLVREVVRNIQDVRKQLGCEISDRIKINISGELNNNYFNYICKETLSDIESLNTFDLKIEVSANNMSVVILIKK